MSTPTVATPPPPTPTPPAPAAAPPSAAKARPGELRAQVAAILAASPGTAFSVTDLMKMLGNSGGAIGNACQTLVARGEARLIGAAPRSYGATAATATAAQRPVITRPAPAPTAAAVPAPASPNPAPPAPPSPSPSTPATGPSAPGPILRPNGQHYHPRSLAGLPDVEALRCLRAANVPVLLYGPPGTGKTSVLEAAFADLITVAGDGDTTVADLIGEYTQDEDGGYRFVYGPLVVAMQEGRALLLDDATLISPKVLAALYPAMDGRRQITVKAHQGEVITAEDGFYVVAGHNPGVHGAILTDALASRFSVQIHVATDYDLARTLKIDPRAVRIARHLATLQHSGEIGWAPQLRELIAFQKIAEALGPDTAFANLVGIAPTEDRDSVADVVRKALGRPLAPLALGKQL